MKDCISILIEKVFTIIYHNVLIFILLSLFRMKSVSEVIDENKRRKNNNEIN